MYLKTLIKYIQGSMSTWESEITACAETLGELEIKRGIFQGDNLSPLMFVICMIPMSSVLSKMKACYVKINSLLSMSNFKMFSKNEKEINSLVSTIRAINEDICVELGVQKCGMLVFKRRILKEQN